MQGRGSGTGYERIAAEYIGSQFRQFGLDGAGDADEAGNKGFVQRVALESVKFTAAPTFTVTSGSDSHNWEFGRVHPFAGGGVGVGDGDGDGVGEGVGPGDCCAGFCGATMPA